MLRRSHDHHRGARAGNATASADGSNEAHQDRYLMTVPQSCKFVRRARRLSASHGGAHSALHQSPQITAELLEFDTTRRSFASRLTVEQRVASARFKSVSSPAAPESP
jgi:hypothetical protein